MSAQGYDRPIGDVLLGLELLPLRDGSTALDAVVLVKSLDADGSIVWCTRYTKDVTVVERIGALRAALVLEERRVVDLYTPESGDET